MTKTAQQAFSTRLRAAMQAKGYTSNTNTTGVDISLLERAAGTTYQAARRYVAGARGRVCGWAGSVQAAPPVLATAYLFLPLFLLFV